MTFLVSFNIRGLGATPKFLALKETLVSVHPLIIFIQETMPSSSDSLAFFRRMFPSWYMVATGAEGMSGGLVVLWNPVFVRAKPYKCCAGILLSASIRGRPQIINILNIYAPYRDRVPFWDMLFGSEILDIKSLLIVGDLNLTLNSAKCWGCCRKQDHMADKMRRELLNRNLVDIIPEKMVPTWDNGRTGPAYIAKRLDRFIINASLIERWGMPMARTGLEPTSDHRPIILEWLNINCKLGYPFKFNGSLFGDKSFNELMVSSWRDIHHSDEAFLYTFREKIQMLRFAAKDWQIKKRMADKRELIDIKKELVFLTDLTLFNGLSFVQKIRISSLEKKKQELLLKEEALWRKKSRATWLREGDRNSKFFHNFANARRAKNSIWNIEDGAGGFLHSQQDISVEASRFFQNLYKRSDNDALYSLWAMEQLPEMFDDVANEQFIKPISEDELLDTIKKLKRDKSPGPDGLPIEFFSHFYDLFKEGLLGMVDASRMSGTFTVRSLPLLSLLFQRRANQNLSMTIDRLPYAILFIKSHLRLLRKG